MLTDKNHAVRKPVGILKELSEEERGRLIFESIEKARRDEASRTKHAVKQAVAKVLDETADKIIKETKHQIALNLLKMDFSIEKIAESTELTIDEVKNIVTNF